MNNKIIVTILIVLLVVIVFTGSYLLLGRTTNTKSSTSPTPLLTSIPTNSQEPTGSTSVLSIPTFTVTIKDDSHNVPPTTTSTTDPYTGKTTTTTIPGFAVDSRNITFTIQNQLLALSYKQTEQPSTYGFYYDIRFEPHYTTTPNNDWTEIYDISLGYSSASTSENTVISFHNDYSPQTGLAFIQGGIDRTFPPDAKVDFQVQAMIGYITSSTNYHSLPFPTTNYTFVGETSGWSPTQTLTIS